MHSSLKVFLLKIIKFTAYGNQSPPEAPQPFSPIAPQLDGEPASARSTTALQLNGNQSLPEAAQPCS
ncbi:unnamed protein product [Arctogadus glacialis]